MRLLIPLLISCTLACSTKEVLQEIRRPNTPPDNSNRSMASGPIADTPPAFPTRDCDKAVFVTEFYIDPRRVKDRMGEFIEFYNGDQRSVALDGWRLTDLGGDSHIIDSDNKLVLRPGEFAVLGVNRDKQNNGGIHIDYEYKQFNLSNDADRVRLEDPCGHAVFDLSYPLARNWPKQRSGHSIELVTDPTSDNKPKWQRSRHRLSSGDYATPGFSPWKKRATRRNVAPKDAREDLASDTPTGKQQKGHQTGGSNKE